MLKRIANQLFLMTFSLCFLNNVNGQEFPFPLRILDMYERPIPTAFCREAGIDLPVDSRGNTICEHLKLYEIGAPGYDTVYKKNHLLKTENYEYQYN